MNLRKHQAEMIEICNQIRNGAKIRNIYALVTPGGGKSALPVIAGSILIPKVADAICWIAPRTALQKQGEQNFMDPLFRRLCGHRLTIRTATNDPNPCRGENGFITTYQALGVDRGTVAEDFRRRRYILVLDEYHHAEEESRWHQALSALVDLAVIRIYMTGTLERGNGKKIAFTPYQEVSRSPVESVSRPAIENDPESRVIRYCRADALAEKAILPITFKLFDGRVKWKTNLGAREEHDLSAVRQKATAAAAVYTALNTGFAKELLDQGFSHWAKHKAAVPSSKLLVVTSGIEQAREALRHLRAKWSKAWMRAEIATSHETEAAHRAIDRFKAGAIDALVTIAMAYEGLDVPAVSHLIVLTHIRSTPWLEQCLARAVRIDPAAGPYEAQAAHVFAPDDILLREVCAKIEAEQLPFVRTRQHGQQEQISLFGDGEGGGNGITPLDGRVTRARGFAIGNPIIPAPMPKTPSEIEADLRESIEAHVRTYCRLNYYMPQRVNGEICKAMGKPRAEMNRAELKHCLDHVRRIYPLSGNGGSTTSAPRRHKRLFPTRPVKWGVAG